MKFDPLIRLAKQIETADGDHRLKFGFDGANRRVFKEHRIFYNDYIPTRSQQDNETVESKYVKGDAFDTELKTNYDGYTDSQVESKMIAKGHYEYDLTLYLHGENEYPLVEYNKATNETETKQVYIYLPALREQAGSPTGLIATQSNNEMFYIIKDHLGSARLVMDDNWQTISWYDYHPFGNIARSQTNTALSYRYTGQEFDGEVGLHNYRARLYDSDLGRFYAMDPAMQMASPFSYAGNNPLIFIDPDGEYFIFDSWISGFFSKIGKGKFFSKETWRNAIQEGNKRADNDYRIWLGLTQIDSNRPWYQRCWQLASRFTWELPQTTAGFFGAQTHNLFGGVKSVSYGNGATLVESKSDNWGAFTLGNYIIADRNTRVGDETFMHEYGHTLQSQMLGWFYIPSIGVPSFFSAKKALDDKSNKYNHHSFWTEHWADDLALKYFGEDKFGKHWRNYGHINQHNSIYWFKKGFNYHVNHPGYLLLDAGWIYGNWWLLGVLIF